MQNTNFEKELPTNYRQLMHINAKNAKFGLIFNLISLLVFFLMGAIAFTSVLANESKKEELIEDFYSQPLLFSLYAFLFILSMLIYIILHEITHGISYKILTGEKLTFGMS